MGVERVPLRVPHSRRRAERLSIVGSKSRRIFRTSPWTSSSWCPTICTGYSPSATTGTPSVVGRRSV